MDDQGFDTLTRSLSAAGSRRRALALALGGALAPLLARKDTAAHDLLAKCKKKSGKQKKTCLKKSKKHNATHSTAPPPTTPPPVDPCAGVSCGAVPHGETTCRNGVCVVSACDEGFRNCSLITADGCHCETPSCCRDFTCQKVHSNGLGQKYYDCVPLGTQDATQADKAAAAFKAAGHPGTIFDSPNYGAADCGQVHGMVCLNGNEPQAGLDGEFCACWSYAGSAKGKAFYHWNDPEIQCPICPSTSDPSWT